MKKTLTVELMNGVFYKQSLAELIKYGCSLYEFLSFLDITDIEEHIKTKYYKRKPRYPANAMIRLAVSYYAKPTGFTKLLNSLSEFDIKLLGLKNAPSKSELHYFINNRLGKSGYEELMGLIAPKLDALSGKQNLSHDSTPVEASRYDSDADYNPHYKCNMYKAHITMKDTIPLLMTFTVGCANDSPYLKPHAYKMKELGITGKLMNLDAGYDSYENHALVNCIVGAVPYIALPCNAATNEDGTLERISHWCNRLWKQGGSKCKTIEEKIQFLFEQGRIEQVGAYFRNNNLSCGMPKEITSMRSRQERIHAHIKDTVKFDVRGRRTSKKELHITAAFVSYQLLVLCSLQNELNPNEFWFIQ